MSLNTNHSMIRDLLIIGQKDVFFSLLTILLVFSFFITTSHCYPFSSAVSTPAEGRAHISRVICTDSGLCLIFYYRTKAPSDVVETNGPYVKAVYLTPSGDLTNPSPSINLTLKAGIINSMDVYEVQEEGDLFRLIGYDWKILYEIW